MKKIGIGLASLALLAGCTGVSLPLPQAGAPESPTPTPSASSSAPVMAETFNADVTVSISGDFGDDNHGCIMPSGYSDLETGSQVVLQDNAGATVSITTITSNVVIDGACTAKMWFTSIPDAPSYRLVIGRRPPYEATKSDLKAGLTLEIDRS